VKGELTKEGIKPQFIHLSWFGTKHDLPLYKKGNCENGEEEGTNDITAVYKNPNRKCVSGRNPNRDVKP